MSTSISIPAGTTFYRYDLSETPSIWNGSYHSIEYSTKEGIENIHKNQCGLLFFYETESTTIKTAERALERHNKTEFWLTTAYVDKPLQLLDLRGGATLVILNNLYVNGIDVFNSPLTITGLKDSIPLKVLEPLYYYLMQSAVGGKEYNDKWFQLHEPFIFPGSPYSLLGQRLTDYENGEVFKSLLIEKKYDGYIFDESFGASTICLMDSTKLSTPESIRFDKPRLFEWNKSYYLGPKGLH
ncbi:MAG TPA: hypothetical protein DD424_01810 [Porphyromonadaceae bacterium]|uniref:hypothetical protein n=1 Tax=Bacteroides acidifaciens TaxID=85831 RepID=UPI000E94F2CC|nr:hypothetical protein [Bacteroides acidifaciens]HBN62620.1 hypothetical protein [Porphyromonadaceae bacterium]